MVSLIYTSLDIVAMSVQLGGFGLHLTNSSDMPVAKKNTAPASWPDIIHELISPQLSFRDTELDHQSRNDFA